MKNNETHLEYKKRVLDILSPSFCAAKWYNATIWLGSGMTTSCHHPTPHFVSVPSIKENYKSLHNTVEKKRDRMLMQIGKRPEGCSYCWKIEDLGETFVSDRPAQSKNYSDRDVFDAFETDKEKDINLKKLEISFDKTCQFACAYCSPIFSSTWVKDIKKNGPYLSLDSDKNGHYVSSHETSQLYDINEENPYIEAFFKWWENGLRESLQELRITGGEPLMSGYTWRLLDRIKNSNGKNPSIAINTNLGVDKKNLEQLLSYTDKVDISIYTSNESCQQVSEYIRDGFKWENWHDNVEFLLQSKRINHLNIMSTVNATCLFSLPDFIEVIVNLKRIYGKNQLFFALNILRTPEFHSINSLPQDIKSFYSNHIFSKLKKYQTENLLTGSEKNHILRLIELLKTPESPNQKKLEKDFKKFYQQYDLRRNKSFENTFDSTLINWYKNINIDEN
jgi:pyruvate-formate lyase-activating enzyme